MDLMKDDIRQEILDIKTCFENQFNLIIEFVDQDNIEKNQFHNEFIRHDVFYKNYFGEASKSKQFQDDLKIYFNNVTNQLEPVVNSGEDDFWESVKDVYDKAGGLELLETVFRRSKHIREYRSGIQLTLDLNSGIPIDEIEYTEEALRVLEYGEDELRKQAKKEVNEVFE